MRPGIRQENPCTEMPKKALHEAVEDKSELWWRPQDVIDARTVGYLPRTAADRK